MPNALVIEAHGSHLRATPVNAAPVRVRTHLGDGVLAYATSDGWLGVRLAGETRVDEYLPEQVTRLEVAA